MLNLLSDAGVEQQTSSIHARWGENDKDNNKAAGASALTVSYDR